MVSVVDRYYYYYYICLFVNLVILIIHIQIPYESSLEIGFGVGVVAAALEFQSGTSICPTLNGTKCEENPDCMYVPVFSCCLEYEFFCVSRAVLVPFPSMTKLTTIDLPIDNIITLSQHINLVNDDIPNIDFNATLPIPTLTPFDLSTVDDILLYDTDTAAPFCFRNKKTRQIYEFQTPFELPDGYEQFTITNRSCKSLDCKSKGMLCTRSSDYFVCDNYSFYCCSPFNECVPKSDRNDIDSDQQYSKPLNSHIQSCSVNCAPGFTCRIIHSAMVCLPKTCDYLKCDRDNECVMLKELGIASCQLRPDYTNVLESCRNTDCPPNFHCGKGLFSNYDCIPNTESQVIDSDAIVTFGCDLCPENFMCNPFSWGILCVENSVFISNVDNCYGTPCIILQQFCNDTTHRCEFNPCDETTCATARSSEINLVCVQRDPTQPRVCTNLDIFGARIHTWDDIEYSPLSQDYFVDNPIYTVN